VEAPSRRELRTVYESLQQSFEDLSQQQQTKAFLTKGFDLMAWLESKINGLSFAEVIQQKFRASH
jgi:hypothetical protein